LNHAVFKGTFYVDDYEHASIDFVNDVMWVPVTTAWRVFWLLMEETVSRDVG
jgi:hypothetical protein